MIHVDCPWCAAAAHVEIDDERPWFVVCASCAIRIELADAAPSAAVARAA